MRSDSATRKTRPAHWTPARVLEDGLGFRFLGPVVVVVDVVVVEVVVEVVVVADVETVIVPYVPPLPRQVRVFPTRHRPSWCVPAARLTVVVYGSVVSSLIFVPSAQNSTRDALGVVVTVHVEPGAIVSPDLIEEVSKAGSAVAVVVVVVVVVAVVVVALVGVALVVVPVDDTVPPRLGGMRLCAGVRDVIWIAVGGP
jgi:hypothetical protein